MSRRDERDCGQNVRLARHCIGAGAGSEPTASSVLPIWSISRVCIPLIEAPRAAVVVPTSLLSDTPVIPMDEVETSYYLRIQVVDKPGVMAEITRIVAEQNISISALLQKEASDESDQVSVIMLTHLTVEKNINAAIARIEALPVVTGKVFRLRIEELNN